MSHKNIAGVGSLHFCVCWLLFVLLLNTDKRKCGWYDGMVSRHWYHAVVSCCNLF